MKLAAATFLALTAAVSFRVASAFQAAPRRGAPPTSSSLPTTTSSSERRHRPSYCPRSRRRSGSTAPFAAPNGDDGNGGGGDVPFFARQTETDGKTRAAESPLNVETSAADDGAAVAVLDAPSSSSSSSSSTTTEEEHEESAAIAEARSLRAQAERARLEAEQMDARLTLDKIAKLERSLNDAEQQPDRQREVRDQIETLTQKLEAKNKGKASASASSSSVDAVMRKAEESSTSVEASQNDDHTSSSSSSGSFGIVDNDELDELLNDFPPITDEELQARTEGFLSSPKVLREMTAAAAGFESDANATEIVMSMYTDEQRLLNKKNLIANGTLPSGITEQEKADAIDGFDKLPQPIRDLIAKSVGLPDGSNATQVVSKMEAEGKLFSDDGMGFEVDTSDMLGDLSDLGVFVDPEFAEMSSYVMSMLPEVTRKDGVTPKEEDVDVFFTKVLGKDTFVPRSKPEQVPGGVIIRGENRMTAKKRLHGGNGDGSTTTAPDGDALIEALDARMAQQPSVNQKVRYFYIKDPTPPSEEQLMSNEAELPVLFVSGHDVSPDTGSWVKPVISSLGVLAVVAFSLGALSFNENVVDRLTSSVDAAAATGDGDVDLGWLTDLATPTVLAVLGTQMAHEAAHRIVAIKDKFEVGMPTIVPSFQLGLTGAITPLKTPPKNMKSLFDFAMAGPLVGMAVSVALLYSGLEAAVFMDAASQAQLPSLPIQLVRSSSLAGGMIEWLLGDGVLLSPDPAAMISLHPFAIAGFVGIISNALALLPTGNTDGGRISHALFGRSFSRIVQGFTLFFMVIFGLFGFDESNLLLSYALFATIWQREPEIPAKNEVDDIDIGRGLLAIFSTVLVALALIPITT